MKKLLYILPVLIFLGACKKNFLDRQPSSALDNSDLFQDSSEVIAAINGCYSGWASSYNVYYLDAASDNVYSQYPWEGFQLYGNGSAAAGQVSPGGYGQNLWNFTTVQRCNWFLANIGGAPVDDALKLRTEGEARFIRVYQYFLMAQLYGDVPLITQNISTTAADTVTRTPKATVTQFMLSELAAIAPNLPQSYSGSDVGRITKGAALALKARIELYNQDWADCITDCQAVMQLGYSLYPSYTDLFRIQHEDNSEVICDVEYQETINSNGNVGVMPSNGYGGWASLDPLSSLVNAYEMSNGKTIDDPASGYNPNQPYTNRDPRLTATIVYPSESYPYATGAANFYDPLDNGTADYWNSGNNCSVTAYTEKKFTAVLSDYDNLFNTGLDAILIRYAEVLLTDAEAKIESGQIDATVYADLNAVRTRAGMPLVDQTAYNNQTTLRTLVRRERRVELALEGLRWFDIQRWQIGPQVMAGTVYGSRLGSVNATTGALTLTADSIKVETRVFDPNKNYLWPIPQSEININPNLKQNPGY